MVRTVGEKNMDRRRQSGSRKSQGYAERYKKGTKQDRVEQVERASGLSKCHDSDLWMYCVDARTKNYKKVGAKNDTLKTYLHKNEQHRDLGKLAITVK